MSAPHLLLASALALLAAACGGGGEPAAPDAPAAAGPAPYAVCPPCRMDVDADAEVVAAGGFRFAVCNPRCGEIVREDPARFEADALP